MSALQTGINRFTALGIPGMVTGNLMNRVDVSMAWVEAAPTEAGALFGTLVKRVSAHEAERFTSGDLVSQLAGFVLRQRQSQNGIGFDASETVGFKSSITIMQKGGLIVQCAEAISDDPTAPIYIDLRAASPTAGQLFAAPPTIVPADSFLISKYVTVVTPSTGAGICEITFSFDYNDAKL